MKWRCTWCGKPHAENDPPCDNCGHNKFEKAIVRDESGATARETGTVDTGTQYLWICADCGRQHMRNNPPCSRCGSHNLEKTEQNYEDIDRELETPSWLEVAKPYAPIFVVLGIVGLLFATGIVPLSVLPGIGPPPMPDAPGEGSEAAGIDLEATEDRVYDRLEGERDASRTADDGLAAYAEYVNRASVAYRYEDERSRSVDPGDFGDGCEPTNGLVALESGLEGEGISNEDELAVAVTDALRSNEDIPTDGPGFEREGVDIHVGPAPAETVYALYATC